jgi:CheY-like chemotaxis protein
MTRSPRIMIVEHEHAVRHGLCLHLELEGCVCEAARDVPSTLQRDDLGTFDLFVCNLAAGVLEAQRLVDGVRGVSGAGYIPILVLATDATRSAAIVSLENGADGFLVKPFGFRELVASVRALLRTRRTESFDDRVPGLWGDCSTCSRRMPAGSSHEPRCSPTFGAPPSSAREAWTRWSSAFAVGSRPQGGDRPAFDRCVASATDSQQSSSVAPPRSRGADLGR